MKTRCVFLFFSLFLVTCFLSLDAHARATVENLSQVEKLFMEGKYERVVTEAGKLIDAGAHNREELFYLKGLSLIQLTMFRQARDTFNYMIERYPKGKRALDGYIGIGDAYFAEGKYADALTSYTEAINKYPDHKDTAVVYYKIGCSWQKLGNAAKAKEYFDKVKSSSPLSFESKMIPQDIAVANPPAPSHEALNKNFESAADTGDYFYVQAGYFKMKGNAQKLAGELRQKGYDSYLSTQVKAGLLFYKVKVGRFKTEAEAEGLAGKLKADGYKTKICR